ncbi:MAG: alpha/beta fold hydrolase [Planctomycetota bacterium]|nr:alpha/beta fold hydrolase [Planctomycetota bacterium]
MLRFAPGRILVAVLAGLGGLSGCIPEAFRMEAGQQEKSDSEESQRGESNATKTETGKTETNAADFEKPNTDTPNTDTPQPATTVSVPMKTLGGRQFWGDLAFFHGWRIQKNVFTGHVRLLDPQNYSMASGTLPECAKRLEEIKAEKKLPQMKGAAVVMIHGILRSSRSFKKMQQPLIDAGYTTIGFDYPSTRVEIEDSAEFLHSVIESLDGIDEINFVVHSMGGLLVRSYLSKHNDKRIKRMVMLGVPNNGANLADIFKGNVLFRTVMGPAGQQLVEDPQGLIKKLPIPEFEFAIIAGGRNTETGFNPFVPGDDDGTVAVESAKLPGCADFAIVNALHSFLMGNEQSIKMTINFFKHGRLHEVGPAHPIPRKEAADSPKP